MGLKFRYIYSTRVPWRSYIIADNRRYWEFSGKSHEKGTIEDNCETINPVVATATYKKNDQLTGYEAETGEPTEPMELSGSSSKWKY